MPAAKDCPAQAELAGLSGLVWDLDNTLYRFDDAFKHACNIAAARAAIKGGVDMEIDEAIAFGWKSYREKGYSITLFIEQFQLDVTRMHHDFHHFIDEKLIAACQDTAQAFRDSTQKHVLLTHASRAWAVRTLAHLGLADSFPAAHIIPAEDVSFIKKSSGTAPFEHALAALGCAAGQAAIIEDMPANLDIPKKMGMTTILVHHGQKPDPRPAFIDYDFNNALSVLRACCC